MLIRSLVLCAAILPGAFAFAQVERGAPLPRKAALGAALAPLSPAELEALKGAAKAGVKIQRVIPNLTAAALGLKEGDVLTQIDGQPVAAPGAVAEAFRTKLGGTPVKLTVLRDGKATDLAGTAAERPRQTEDGMTVHYDQVVSKGKSIRVIVVSPKTAGPHPTVFVIGGIGAYSMDGPFASTPYGNLLTPLAKAGYAIVRIDKPGMGDSEGPAYSDLLFDDELDAYVQSLRLVKTLPMVDPSRIAIFGHSMGGAFGPLVANQEKVAGVIAGATMVKTWPEYMLENTRRQDLLGGTPAGQVDQNMRPLARVVNYLFSEGWSPDRIRKEVPDLAPTLTEMMPDGKTYSGVGIPFFQQLAQKNLAAAWEGVQAPVLLFWGENDFVSTEWDHQFAVETINRLRPGTATYMKLAQSDHGFNRTTSFRDSLEKWGKPGGVFNPNVVEVVQTWLDKHLKPTTKD